MMRSVSKGLAGLVVASGCWLPLRPLRSGSIRHFRNRRSGPGKAKGVVVWSHGRSINDRDSKSPTPAYLQALREDGWDVMRFDRLSRGDTLTDSTRRLVDYTASLKKRGYKQVVLAGQSFGAFLSLMAADASPQVDAVVATAPAAYGSFDEFYDSWRLNATKLYPLIEQVQRARVMVFYFHGDNFDPGGRGDRSREILTERGLGFAVVDQPAYLTTPLGRVERAVPAALWRLHPRFRERRKAQGRNGLRPALGHDAERRSEAAPRHVRTVRAARRAAGRHDDGSGALPQAREGLGRVPRCLVRVLPERARGSARDRSDPGR